VARVLILSLIFPPDAVSTAQIMGDLGQDLSALGHSVTVLTTTPHYNHDPEADARQPRRPFWGRLVQRSEFRGLPVFHTAMPRKTGSIPKRLLAWSLFHVLSLAVGVVAIRKIDVVVTPSPPLTMGVVAWLLGAWHRAPFVYNVQEIYPDIAINLGALRNRTAIRLLYALERFVYGRATAITVIAGRMQQRLLEKGVESSKLEVIPNFVDLDVLPNLPAPNDFTREFGLDGRFVVSYAGNLGPAQGLETLLDAAALLRDVPAIVIVLIGNGSLWGTLEARIRDERLSNVLLLPYQPFSRVPSIYGGSALSVVAQAVATGTDAVPSKVYRIMACSGAVLAVTNPRSDLAQLVRTAACGFVVAQQSPQEVADAIRVAHADRAALAALGAAGRRHVTTHYTRPVVTRRYDELIRRVIGARAS
jgi:colanic acid biosynthesis glycosyl transferase WcaI